MDEAILQRVTEQLKKAKRILIALPEVLTIDTTASAVALRAGLGALQKAVVLASSGAVPERTHFLLGSEAIRPLRQSTSDLVITVDTSRAAVGEMTYEVFPGKTVVYVRGAEGGFSPSDVRVTSGELPFDLIITLGVEKLEQLGSLFTNHAELFYAVPKVNIDTSPYNESYGVLNLLVLTSSSLAEVCYRVLRSLGEQATVPGAATALLAGVLARTDSLQNQQTTPESFAVVADLIAAGAEYQGVVKQLFKTERLSFLKLFGRALARLKLAQDAAFAQVVLLPIDFEKTGERPSVASAVLAELLDNTPGLQTIALAVPREDATGSRVLISAGNTFKSTVVEEIIQAGPPSVRVFDNGKKYFEYTSTYSVEKLDAELFTALSAHPAV
ncbi:MAG: hypothetical protein JNK33_02335 [Candidatus Doudnabacteria bacterium]|nr:hypothetical protein [Candidatus Doudnabacteria bacterium]